MARNNNYPELEGCTYNPNNHTIRMRDGKNDIPLTDFFTALNIKPQDVNDVLREWDGGNLNQPSGSSGQQRR